MPGASSSNDCSSWASACDLQTALTWPPDWPSGKIIRLSGGVYTPHANNRSISFEITQNNNGVALYGGYVGGVGGNANNRDPGVYKTILSGNIDDLGTNGR